MGISSWVVGQTSPTWTIIMVRDNGGTMDLTGVTVGQLSLIIYNSSFARIGTGAGTFLVLNANPGIVRYHPDATDSSPAGNKYVRVEVNYNGTDPDYSDRIFWEVQA